MPFIYCINHPFIIQNEYILAGKRGVSEHSICNAITRTVHNDYNNTIRTNYRTIKENQCETCLDMTANNQTCNLKCLHIDKQGENVIRKSAWFLLNIKTSYILFPHSCLITCIHPQQLTIGVSSFLIWLTTGNVEPQMHFIFSTFWYKWTTLNV